MLVCEVVLLDNGAERFFGGDDDGDRFGFGREGVDTDIFY